jgi:hypothetical protein
MNEHLIKAKRIGKNFNVVIEEQKYTKVVESEQGKQLMEVVKTYNEKLEKTKSDTTAKKLYKQFLKEVGFEDKSSLKDKEVADKKKEKKEQKDTKKKKGIVKSLVDNLFDIIKGTKEEDLSEEDRSKLKKLLEKENQVPEARSSHGSTRSKEY